MSTVALEKFTSAEVRIMPELGYAPFDADSHYYEAEDALTRHLPKEWRRRGPQWIEMNGRKRLMLGGKLYTYIPNPTFDPIARPGCAHDYFAAKEGGKSLADVMGDLEPIRPEYRDRDARLKVMDEQGIGASWLFPTLAVTLEVSFRPDHEAAAATIRAFNRWLAEDWGFAYKDRIFAAPVITLSDPDWAVEEIEWCIRQGAKAGLDAQRSGLYENRNNLARRAGIRSLLGTLRRSRRDRCASRGRRWL